jgi:hypothetical protein
VSIIAIGKTIIAVGIGCKVIPRLINNQLSRIALIAPKDINSPWAKFENLKTL